MPVRKEIHMVTRQMVALTKLKVIDDDIGVGDYDHEAKY